MNLSVYQRPKATIVDVDTDDDLLQEIIDVSGEPGPGVNTDPEDPDPGAGLANYSSVWAQED